MQTQASAAYGGQSTTARNSFASELEMRWEVFFDALDVRWSYRPKIYLPTGVRFEPLPQFWLAFSMNAQFPYRDGIPQERGLWVGVSPVPPDAETKWRYQLMARLSRHWVHLLVGKPADGFEAWSWRFSERYRFDALHSIADLSLRRLGLSHHHGSAFDIDFMMHTVGDAACDLDLAFKLAAFREGVESASWR
jgi:hypothetical protein